MFRSDRVQRHRFLQVILCRGPVAQLQSYLASMREDFGIADSDRQRSLDLLAGFRVLTGDVQRPGVGIERVHVVTPRVLLLRHFQSVGWLVRVIGIVEDEFAVGIILTAGLRQ